MVDRNAANIDTKTNLAGGQPVREHADAGLQIGFRVRLNLRAGEWRCTSCSGETVGANLFKPQCEYCEKY